MLSCTPLTIQQWACCVFISSGELLWAQLISSIPTPRLKFLKVVGHREMTEGGLEPDNVEMSVRRRQHTWFRGRRRHRIDPQVRPHKLSGPALPLTSLLVSHHQESVSQSRFSENSEFVNPEMS
uniref:Uncharacterized protein n=1 Tax=Amphiprion percula TaxID=161767 RepID=A0A3P8RY10_AMPPE